jgi:integrase
MTSPQAQDYKSKLQQQETRKGLPLSEASIKSYTQKLDFLVSKGYDKIWGNPTVLIQKLEKDYPKVISRKGALMGLIKYFKTMGNIVSEETLLELNEEYMKMSEEYVEKNDKNEKNDKEQNEWIEWEDLLKYKSKIKNDHQFLAIFKFYTENPPMRNDVYNLKHKNYDEAKDNFIDLKTGEVTINEYKESKSYGPIKITLSKGLLANIKRLPKTKEYVFHNASGNPFSNSRNFTEYMTDKFESLTGKKIGTTMLRKIFSSWFNKQNPTLEERKRVAYIMGHAVQTGLTYDRKEN